MLSTSTLATPPRTVSTWRTLRRAYRRYIEPRFPVPWLWRQRVRLCYFGWGYWELFRTTALTRSEQLWLLWRCLRIDWSVPHGHEHGDISKTIAELGARRARRGEVMIEAGCWQGGSTAKWSLACRLLGYRLHVYDSFQGVEARTDQEGSYDYSGEYSATLETVRDHVRRYGALEVCTFHPGWFADTMKPGSVPGPVRLVYIDCDLAKGTQEVLAAVLPVLSEDGVVVSEDCQIKVVAELLANPDTWHALGATLNGGRFSRHLGVFYPLQRRR